MVTLSLDEYAYLNDDYDLWINKLAESLARKERWDYIKDESSYSYPILRNYLNHTFRRIQELSEEKPEGDYWVITSQYSCFNTGLFSENYEPIYALFEIKTTPSKKSWKFRGFYNESDYKLTDISPLPTRANYFDDISQLYYDTKYELRVNMDHILDEKENFLRIPEKYRDLPNLAMMFKATGIQYALIRIKENYRAAVPQYFNQKVQFLIPISLGNPSVVDLALAVSKVGSIYIGKTCLTLDMAYNNARLIARPETDWLF